MTYNSASHADTGGLPVAGRRYESRTETMTEEGEEFEMRKFTSQETNIKYKHTCGSFLYLIVYCL